MTPEGVRAADERWAATHARLLESYPAASTEALGQADGECGRRRRKRVLRVGA